MWSKVNNKYEVLWSKKIKRNQNQDTDSSGVISTVSV